MPAEQSRPAAICLLWSETVRCGVWMENWVRSEDLVHILPYPQHPIYERSHPQLHMISYRCPPGLTDRRQNRFPREAFSQRTAFGIGPLGLFACAKSKTIFFDRLRDAQGLDRDSLGAGDHFPQCLLGP